MFWEMGMSETMGTHTLASSRLLSSGDRGRENTLLLQALVREEEVPVVVDLYTTRLEIGRWVQGEGGRSSLS